MNCPTQEAIQPLKGTVYTIHKAQCVLCLYINIDHRLLENNIIIIGNYLHVNHDLLDIKNIFNLFIDQPVRKDIKQQSSSYHGNIYVN